MRKEKKIKFGNGEAAAGGSWPDVEADEVWDMDWTRLGAAGPGEGPVPCTDAATDSTIATSTTMGTTESWAAF